MLDSGQSSSYFPFLFFLFAELSSFVRGVGLAARWSELFFSFNDNVDNLYFFSLFLSLCRAELICPWSLAAPWSGNLTAGHLSKRQRDKREVEEKKRDSESTKKLKIKADSEEGGRKGVTLNAKALFGIIFVLGCFC